MSPTESSGHRDLDRHHRLEHHRVGLGVGLAERERAGDLERHLGRVDVVVRAVDEPDPDADHREARPARPSASTPGCPCRRRRGSPAGSRRRRSCRGTRSPRGRAAARSRCGSRRTGRGRRSASCAGRGRAPPSGSPRGTGTRGGCVIMSTPKRRLTRSTVTSMCICERPSTSCSPVRSSRCTPSVGSSSCRRRSAWLSLSSSPFFDGSTATETTGEGSVHRRDHEVALAVDQEVAGGDVLQLADGADLARPRTPSPRGAPCPARRAARPSAPCRACAGSAAASRR